MVISQMGPVELINFEAGEMGQFVHYKTFAQSFACTEVVQESEYDLYL